MAPAGITPDPTPAQERERAREVILRRLSVRAHSRAELDQALALKGVDASLAAELLDRFSELDLVDDAAFADQWVASRHRTRRLSRRALGEELRRKGVNRELIDEATAVVGPEQEHEAAVELVRKKLRSGGGSDEVVLRRRVAGMLARRGYGYAVIQGAIAEVLGEEQPPIS